jgi:hypothetical protein
MAGITKAKAAYLPWANHFTMKHSSIHSKDDYKKLPQLINKVVQMPACSPVTLDRPSRPPDKEIFEYIQAYSSIFEVFLKNIQRIF